MLAPYATMLVAWFVGKAGKRGLAVGYSGSALGGLTGDLGGFQKSNVGKATEDAVSQAVDFLKKQLESIPWEGSVALVKDAKIVINRGTREGVSVGQEFVVGALEEVKDDDTGEVLIDANSELTPTVLSKLIEAGIAEFEVFFPERDDVGSVIAATIRKDAVKDQRDALIEIYRKLRPGDPPTVDTATQLFQGMFFDPRKYDFSRGCRMKFNIKLYDRSDSTALDKRTLDAEDFKSTIKYLLKLR